MEEVNESAKLWRRHCGVEQEARPEILIVNLWTRLLVQQPVPKILLDVISTTKNCTFLRARWVTIFNVLFKGFKKCPGYRKIQSSIVFSFSLSHLLMETKPCSINRNWMIFSVVGWMVVFKKICLCPSILEPVKMLLFGNCVIAGVIHLKILRWDHSGLPRWLGNSVTSVLLRYRRGKDTNSREDLAKRETGFG